MTIKEKILSYIKENKKPDSKLLAEIAKRSKGYDEFKQALVESRILSEEELLLIFSKELKIPFLDIKKYKLPPNNQEFLPQEAAFKYQVLPICKIGKILTIATSNPLDVIVTDDLKIITKADRIDLVISRQEDIAKALDSLYQTSKSNQTFVDQESSDLPEESEVKEDLETLINESKHPPIVRAIDLIIYNSLKKRASDIHIEPYEDKVMVKYRVDGVLHEEFNFPKRNQQAIIARLKIISSLDITESRLPQDGRFKVSFQNRDIDFRVSILPTNFGEKFVLRVLDKENLALGLKQLGFSDEPLKLFEEAVSIASGLILVTGPTGSGKSTTLYSIINQINNPDKNIITIEEPVEYILKGITQVPANVDIGLTFACGLRSLLRQAPDVIMVGEIRDFDTADIAIKASLAGGLIFSTLHTNSAVGSITRLIDMNIEPFLLASSLISVTAQRLVRKLCPKCKEKYKLESDVLKRLDISLEKETNIPKEFYRAKGCKFCADSGYRGRVALIEIIFLDDQIREMIVQKRSETEIIQYAKTNKDFKFLREDGFLKCCQGITSIEEVIRVTSE